METIINYLCTWSLRGFIACLIIPIPKIKKNAKIALFLFGPFCWVIFTFVIISKRITGKWG